MLRHDMFDTVNDGVLTGTRSTRNVPAREVSFQKG